MIVRKLSHFAPLGSWLDGDSLQPQGPVESLRGYLARIKDEVLWPCILVRHEPPTDEIRPFAPGRS